MSLVNELFKKITKKFAFMEFPLSMSRQGDFPLDKSSLWWDLEEAKTYAKSNPTAYPGQPITVVDESANTVTLFVVGVDGNLVAQGGMASVDALKQELAQHKVDYNALKTAHEQLKAAHDQLKKDHDALSGKHDTLQAAHTTLSGKHDTLQGEHNKLKQAHDTLAADEAQLKKDHQALDAKHTALDSKVTALDTHEKQLKTDFDALKAKYDAHTHTTDQITETSSKIFMTPAQKTKLDAIAYAAEADIDGLFPELQSKP